MKKFVFLTAIIFFGLSVNLAFAQILPFGGRITAIKTPPNVQCPTDPSSPFTIMPAGSSSASPWAVGPGQVSFGRIIPNAWILGLYNLSSCVMTNPPPAPSSPYPVFFSNFYGTSATFGQ
jgi:hypothetical protein